VAVAELDWCVLRPLNVVLPTTLLLLQAVTPEGALAVEFDSPNFRARF